MDKIFLTLFFLPIPFFCLAQSIQPSVINASGGWIQDSNSTILVEWSLGELAIATINDTSIITQGVLQPDLVRSNDYYPDEQIAIYPNPTTGHLFFETTSTHIASLIFFDILGYKILETSFVTDLDIQYFQSGFYTLVLLDKKNRLLSIFKIIKI